MHVCGLWTRQRNRRVSALAYARLEDVVEQGQKLPGLRNGVGDSQIKALENTSNRD